MFFFLFFYLVLFLFNICILDNISNVKFIDSSSMNIKCGRYFHAVSQYPSTDISNILQYFISRKIMLSSGSGIWPTIFLLLENTVTAFWLYSLSFSIPKFSISRNFKCLAIKMMSFHSRLNLCLARREAVM